jgi:hypothetical protein
MLDHSAMGQYACLLLDTVVQLLLWRLVLGMVDGDLQMFGLSRQRNQINIKYQMTAIMASHKASRHYFSAKRLFVCTT